MCGACKAMEIQFSGEMQREGRADSKNVNEER